MRKASIFQTLTVAMCLTTLLAHAQKPREIAERTFPSVLLLVMQDSNGQTISLGSGFFVESDVIATNLHVIEKAASGYARIVGEKTKYDIVGCVGVDTERDLALVKVRGANAPILPLAERAEVAIGDEVYVVGNPRGLEGTFSSGIVSGIRRSGDNTLLQITAPISPGSSGGPVLDSLGRVIGIAMGMFKMGENLNFAIPAAYLATLLENKTAIKRLPVRQSVSREKRMIFDQGAKGVVGTDFSWGLDLLREIQFSFSLRNELRQPVKNVHYLVIFYDRHDKPIEIYDFAADAGGAYGHRVIPPGLARRIEGYLHRSVRPLTARVEIRILDFEFVE